MVNQTICNVPLEILLFYVHGQQRDLMEVFILDMQP